MRERRDDSRDGGFGCEDADARRIDSTHHRIIPLCESLISVAMPSRMRFLPGELALHLRQRSEQAPSARWSRTRDGIGGRAPASPIGDKATEADSHQLARTQHALSQRSNELCALTEVRAKLCSKPAAPCCGMQSNRALPPRSLVTSRLRKEESQGLSDGNWRQLACR